jgi:hypothetical protein
MKKLVTSILSLAVVAGLGTAGVPRRRAKPAEHHENARTPHYPLKEPNRRNGPLPVRSATMTRASCSAA